MTQPLSQSLSFHRAERAIMQLTTAGQHIALDELAADAGLSPSHFQREFKRMTGVSPKQMSQLLARDRMLAALKQSPNVLDATFAAGLSSTSRAQELILTTEGATPAQVRMGGETLRIAYAVVPTDLGDAFAAWTGSGLCKLAFGDDPAQSFAELKADWPRATFYESVETITPYVKAAMSGDTTHLTCHIRGTHFQLKVWQALMRLPSSTLVTYGAIAQALGLKAMGARAVGNAVGANPVAIVIPCHRVIRENGSFTGYRWGPARKSVLLARELSALDEQIPLAVTPVRTKIQAVTTATLF
jgi:AraC family transcriptional regulator, regulatory protein of adaptative response / methylated-DNA-[protein]-cysteine methyltransferase